MSRSDDPGHYFQTTDSLATSERKAAKAKNNYGDPRRLSSKILALLSYETWPGEVIIAEAAGVIRRVNLSVSTPNQPPPRPVPIPRTNQTLTTPLPDHHRPPHRPPPPKSPNQPRHLPPRRRPHPLRRLLGQTHLRHPAAHLQLHPTKSTRLPTPRTEGAHGFRQVPAPCPARGVPGPAFRWRGWGDLRLGPRVGG